MADIEKNKWLIYFNGHERPNILDYRNRFCSRWFNKYLPRMYYFEGVDMKRVDPDSKAGETDIVALFHNEIIFRANGD